MTTRPLSPPPARRRNGGRYHHGHAVITRMAMILSVVFALAMVISRLAHP